jgi:acyl dehydratase
MPDAPASPGQACFENATVGAALPPLKKGPYTVEMMAKFACVSADFYPSHYDNKWATQKSGHKGALAHGLQITTFLSQLVTDWMSPYGMLKKFSAENRRPTFDGDTLTFHGTIKRREARDGEGVVELDLYGENQDGVKVITGQATISLPLASKA